MTSNNVSHLRYGLVTTPCICLTHWFSQTHIDRSTANVWPSSEDRGICCSTGASICHNCVTPILTQAQIPSASICFWNLYSRKTFWRKFSNIHAVNFIEKYMHLKKCHILKKQNNLCVTENHRLPTGLVRPN